MFVFLVLYGYLHRKQLLVVRSVNILHSLWRYEISLYFSLLIWLESDLFTNIKLNLSRPPKKISIANESLSYVLSKNVTLFSYKKCHHIENLDSLVDLWQIWLSVQSKQSLLVGGGGLGNGFTQAKQSQGVVSYSV